MNGIPESPMLEDVHPANPIISTEKRRFIVYKITNQVNGKIYIGQTVKTLKQRLKQHFKDALRVRAKTGLPRAIRKYGGKNFVIDLLGMCESKKQMDEMEKMCILELNARVPRGYNLTDGGDGQSPGYSPGLETRLKLSKSRMGNKNALGTIHTPEYRVGQSECMMGKKHSLGYKHPPEQNAAQSERMMGHKASAQTRERISSALKGKKLTDEHKANLSKAHMGYKHTAEQKANIAKAKKAAWIIRKQNEK